MQEKQNFIETITWGDPEYLCTDFGPLAMVREPGSKVYDENCRDVWGVKWGAGSEEISGRLCVVPGHDVIKDIRKWDEQIVIPDVRNDQFDYVRASSEAYKINRSEKIVCLNCTGGVFERTHFLLGFENCLINLLLEPHKMCELMDAITDVKIDLIRKTWEAVRFEAIFYHDDWGSKTSLFFKPETWREIIKPRHRRVVDAVKSLGDGNVIFIHHSDTYLEPLIPDMIEMGIDVWQGCIPQNDIVMLQKMYRGQIAFMGGIDIAKIDRAHFSEQEIRKEVRRAVDTYAPHGGFVPGIPSGSALHKEVQKIYLDEVNTYAEDYSKKHICRRLFKETLFAGGDRMKRIEFSEDELKVVGTFPPTVPQGNTIDKLNTPISAKENLMAFLHNKAPLWMPNGDYITFTPAIIPDNVARGHVIEIDPMTQKGGPDMFGIEWEYIEDVGGSIVRPGSPALEDVNDWKKVITFPDISAWDWEGCAQRNSAFLGNKEEAVWITHYTGLFERLISYMDFENAAVALIDEDQKDAVKELFSALCDLYEQIIDHYVRYFGMTGLLFHDDWGSQKAPFFSIQTFREMILPYMQRLTSYCHERNVIFELHSCGLFRFAY